MSTPPDDDIPTEVSVDGTACLTVHQGQIREDGLVTVADLIDYCRRRGLDPATVRASGSDHYGLEIWWPKTD